MPDAPNPSPEVMAMARRIAGKVFRDRARKLLAFSPSYDHMIWSAKIVEQGDGDDYDLVQSALAAIIETTEDIADWLDSGYHDLPSAIAEEIATALRSHDHLKGNL